MTVWASLPALGFVFGLPEAACAPSVAAKKNARARDSVIACLHQNPSLDTIGASDLCCRSDGSGSIGSRSKRMVTNEREFLSGDLSLWDGHRPCGQQGLHAVHLAGPAQAEATIAARDDCGLAPPEGPHSDSGSGRS